MSGVIVTTVTRPPTADKVNASLRFGVARGLTQTAQAGQKAVNESLRETFTIRGSWMRDNSPFSIKIKPASIKEENLEAEVRTRADWLELHETGGVKKPRGGHRLTIPTENVKRRRQIIKPEERAAAIRNRGGFVLKTRRGKELIAIRRGRGKRKDLQYLYNLSHSAKIKRQSTFFDPLKRVVSTQMQKIILASIEKALQPKAPKPTTSTM